MRLIDADKAINKLKMSLAYEKSKAENGSPFCAVLNLAISVIETMPTEEPTEEMKHGFWIFDGLKTTKGNDYGKYTCSECHTDFPDHRKFCAECGAIMDKPMMKIKYVNYYSDNEPIVIGTHEYYSSHDENNWHGRG